MAISAGDLANMRAGNQLVKPHLNVTPKVTIATMQINQSSYSWPLAQLTVDNVSMNGGLAFADIPVGSLVWIGTTAGTHNVTTTVIRKPPSGTTLFISACGPGDPGYAQYDHTKFADDYHITVFATKPLWSLLSRIQSATFYKRYDVSYVDEGSDPPPVCNIGPWQRLALTGATVSGTFTNAAITDVKPASFAWGSKTISSYSWSFRNSSYALNTGGSFDGGSASAAATIDFDTAGFYIVYCTLTDSGGKTHTGETYVWVVDGSNESDLTGWYIEQDKQDLQGRQITFGRYGDTAETVVFPGAGFLYTEEHTFNSTTVTAGATVTTFAGFVKTEKPSRAITHGKTLFEVVSPAALLKEIPNASQYILEDSSPANWTEVSSDLSHPSGVAWYLLQHHCPAMLQVFDYAPLIDPDGGAMDTSYRDREWLVSGKSLWDQIKEILPHQINAGCDSQGTLYLRHKPQLMASSDRDLVDERMTWGAADIRESLEYSSIIRIPVGILDGYAFSYNGTTQTPYWSRSPGDTQAQGKQTVSVNRMVVPSASGQVTLRILTGHLFAQANSPTPQMIFRAMRNFDTADPARMVWHKLNAAATYDPRGVGWSNHRMLPVKVNRKWERQESGAWIKRIDITMQPETNGQPGLTKQIPISSEGDWAEFGDWFDPFAWGEIISDDLIYNPAISGNEPIIAMFTTDGYVYYTSDFTTTSDEGGPTWARTNLSMSGTPMQFVVDAFSPGYTGEGTAVNGWVATTTNIYRITDIFGTPAAASQHAFANATSGVNMDFSFGADGWGVCVYNSTNNGVYCTYTTDSGSTWSADAAITAFFTNTTPNGGSVFTPGLYVSPKTSGLVYAGAWDALNSGNIYKSTDYGATWALGTGDFNADKLFSGIGVDFHVPYARASEDRMWYTESSWGGGGILTTESWYATSAGSTWGNNTNAPVFGHGGYASSPQDNNYMAMFAKGAYGLDGTGGDGYLFTSIDAGANWTTAYNFGLGFMGRVAIAGNDKSMLYIYGGNASSVPLIYASNDFAANIDNRYGNITEIGGGGAGYVVGIAGRGG